MVYHTVELVCTVLSLLALVVWWECSCRLDCIGRCWQFYVGMPILTFGWTLPDVWIGPALQIIGAAIMVDSAYVLWRRVRGRTDFTTALWRFLHRTFTGISHATHHLHHR